MIQKNDCWISKLEAERIIKEKSKLEEGDFYFNSNGQIVFTEQYHKKRGFCCENNCLHCAYKDLSEGDEYRERNFDNYED
jgi:hypothetical protein